jgi:L,D-transpeptidase ErfK/SrfK
MLRVSVSLAFLLGPAQAVIAAEYRLPTDGDLIGEVQLIEAQHEDTFVKLARQYNVGFEALRQANPDVDAWLPGAGTEIRIPTRFVLPRAERRGIVVNLPELRLYYFPDDGSDRVFTYPISIGRMDWGTPLGRTEVIGKTVNPTWYPPQSIRDEHAAMNDPLPAVVPPGPDNPLGKHKLTLGIPGYLIHGTNKPSGVGMRVTHGCIRMFPEDIEALFSMVGTGTSVRLINQPFKLGWDRDALHMEAHLPLGEQREGEEWTATELTRLVVAATEERRVSMRWDLAERVMVASRGIPESVSVPGTLTLVLPESELPEAADALHVETPIAEAAAVESSVPGSVGHPAEFEGASLLAESPRSD